MWPWTSYLNIQDVRWTKRMDNKSDDQSLVKKDTIDDNRKISDEKIKEYYSKLDQKDSKLDKIMAIIEKIMDQNQYSNSFPDNMDSQKSQDNTTVVLANKKISTIGRWIL